MTGSFKQLSKKSKKIIRILNRYPKGIALKELHKKSGIFDTQIYRYFKEIEDAGYQLITGPREDGIYYMLSPKALDTTETTYTISGNVFKFKDRSVLTNTSKKERIIQDYIENADGEKIYLKIYQDNNPIEPYYRVAKPKYVSYEFGIPPGKTSKIHYFATIEGSKPFNYWYREIKTRYAKVGFKLIFKPKLKESPEIEVVSNGKKKPRKKLKLKKGKYFIEFNNVLPNSFFHFYWKN